MVKTEFATIDETSLFADKVNAALTDFFKSYTLLKVALLGALASLSLPPLNLWWLLFLIIPSAAWLLQHQAKAPLWRAFAIGWCFGFGYFIVTLHWIGYAFFVDWQHDLWMMPFALGGLSAFLSIYWSLGFGVAHVMQRRGFSLWLTLPVCMAIAEWLRGNLFTGFPWGVFGQAVDGMGPVAQGAALFGMPGLTLLMWLWPASLLGLAKNRKTALALLATLPTLLLWGAWRLEQNPTQFRSDLMVRLVQPNISQSDKWRASNARQIWAQLLTMTAAPSSTGQPITHIIWPESSVPFLLDEAAEGRAELAKFLQPNQVLLAGSIRRDEPKAGARYFTSILAYDDKAEVIGRYDKWHLVPGGEFLPLAWLIEPLGFRLLVGLPESFTAGAGPANLEIPRAGKVGMSVCYEAIFPGAISDPDQRADWLANVTNDGWFGTSTGPWQHLAQLRLRAIEQGLPVARAANTGISAIIDSHGRIVFESTLNTQGNFDLALPTAAATTLYFRWHDFMLVFMLVGIVSIIFLKKIQ